MVPFRTYVRAHVAGAIFVAALVGGTALHLCLLPIARHLAAAHINRALGPLLTGRIRIERIHRIGLDRLEGIDASVQDASGQSILRVRGLDVRISTVQLLRSLWRAKEPVALALPSVSIAEVDLALDPDENGTPRIARALSPRPSSKTMPAGSSSAGVVLAIPDIRVAHAQVHALSNGPFVADLTDLKGNVFLSSAGLTVDVAGDVSVIDGLPRGGHARGVLRAHLDNPSRGPLAVHAVWNGSASAVRETLDFSLRGDQVDAALDVAPAGAPEVCALFPEWPIAAVCTAHLDAHGTLPRVNLSAHAQVGPATLDMSGGVTTGPVVQSSLHFDLRDFDGRSLAAPVPLRDLSASGEVASTMRADGEIDGRATLVLRRATYRGTALPPASATVDFGRPAASTFRGHAEVSIEEPEAPVQIALVFDPREGSPVLTFVADAYARELASVPQSRGVIAGGVDVHAKGSLFMGSASIDATVSAVATGLRASGVSIAHARLEAHAIGRWAAPVANVEIEGETIDAAPVHLSAFRAQGRVSFEGVPVMRDLTLDVAGDAAPVRARVGLLRIDPAGLQVDDARVEGLGEPIAGSAHVSSSSMTVVAHGKRIDLVRIGSFVTLPLRAGSVAIDVDASTTARSAEGHFALDLTHGAVGNLRDATGHLEATVHGRRVSARATLNADDLATLQVSSSVLEIGDGPLLSAGPWRQAWGRVDLDGHADLAKLAGRLPADTLPLAEMRGMLRIHAALGRDSLVDMTPEVDATITTDGLVIAGTRGSGAWRLDGLNPSIHISVNGDTGATLLTGQLADGKGPLFVLSAASNAVPYSALFSETDVTDALVSTPFDAKMEMPPRRLDSLPTALGIRKFRGTLRGEVLWAGSLRQPTVTVDASFDRGHAEPQLIGLPVDVSARARYDGVRLEIAAHGSQKGKSMVDATGVVSATAHDWLSGNQRWTASTRVKLFEFPLRSFEALDDRQVRGNLSGELSLDGLNEQASTKAELHFDGVQVGEVACRSADVNASLDGHALDVQLALEQTDGGTIASHIHVGSRWGAKITPELDPTSLAQISLKAKRFRAAMLLPFLSGTLSQLDGRIDGDAGLDVDPIHESARPHGALTFEDGTFELGSMGSEFRDAQARVTFSPNGVVHLQDARARGPSGRLEASGTAWLAGLGFGGASAGVRVPAADPLPLVVDGVQLGKIDGRIDVTMTRNQRETDLDVSVPAARIELPATSDSRDVEDLGDIDGVRVGMAARDRTFIEVPLDASSDETGPDVRSSRRATGTPTKIDVRLGQDVRVLRGNTLDVRLLGQPTVVIDRDVRVSGQVRLARGSVDVQGKPFELEPGGTVTFVGNDATNPQVVLSAHWTAPDSTKIYASFTGPLKTGKVTLRSEPAKSQNEILALILFGTSDQPSTGSVPETTSMAAAAGGAATQPLNQALGGVNHALDKLGLAAGISTKVDTSTPNPRPEVELQIARDISLQVAWVLGLPPASSPDTTLVTLDWRFLKKWSLETTVGDMGTSILDVVWQHRY